MTTTNDITNQSRINRAICFFIKNSRVTWFLPKDADDGSFVDTPLVSATLVVPGISPTVFPLLEVFRVWAKWVFVEFYAFCVFLITLVI